MKQKLDYIIKLYSYVINPTKYKNTLAAENSVTAEFVDYYTRNIKPLLDDTEYNRLTYLAIIRNRINTSIKVLLGLILFIFLLKFEPVEKIYSKIGTWYNLIMEGYHNWWKGLPAAISFFLPSKLIYWSFPGPIIITLFTLLGLTIWNLIPYFSYYKSYKDDLLLRIANFFGKFEYKDEASIIPNFYNALILPSYDEYVISDVIATSIDGKEIEIADISVNIYKEGKMLGFDREIRLPIVNGLLIGIDLGNSNAMQEEVKVIIGSFGQKRLNRNYADLIKTESNSNIDLYGSNDDIINSIKKENFELILQNLLNIHTAEQKKEYYFDIKLIEWFRGNLLPEIDNAEYLQVSFYKNQLFILIPFKNGLLKRSSIFTNPINQLEIKLIAESINSAYKIAKDLKNYRN
jgi:hypothetical protein